MNPLDSRSPRLRSLHIALCLCFGGVALLAGQAHAQAVPGVGANATIGNGAGAGVTGAFAVNETAGLDNAQANQITLTNGGSVGNANVGTQSASVAAKVTTARASIEANAFSNTSGAVLVNQSAGAGNLQRNSTQIGTAAVLGVETVSDGELSATAPKNGSLGQSIGVHSVREANISSDAFKNVSGIVQINQTAGAGNATANSFVLRPPAGTFFN
ncbi:hypothetical protein NDK50_15850 [Paraburkholderia bryophila]|uniref:hypothetical protein n=1 Tax=Paraburkholderia bryophila TaxID=420952 RepID=UPI0023497020|nr:hypothetical protein [Paraburkholderia bryophila]WCM18892.1 hypothetical protein NDK50_15850 [Paraburkholderia bryophila]